MAEGVAIFEARILIVDDLPANILLLQTLLQQAGYRNLHSTTNPFAVCEMHQAQGFDLILLDLHMPGMDGFAVMAALKAMDASGYTPILAITAQPEHRVRALRSGAKDFISKPFNLLELTTRIYNMVEVRLLYKQLEQTAHAMERVALHDELTGLPNRRLLLDRLSQARQLTARSRQFNALMFLDLDHFKQLNDNRGHAMGDLLLQQVAERLRVCVRACDSVARFGGDEFVVLLAELGPPLEAATVQAMRVAQKVQQALQRPYILQGMEHQSSASLGVVMFSGNAPAQEDLLKQADHAMYQAKAAGRDQTALYAATPSAAAPLAACDAGRPGDPGALGDAPSDQPTDG